jgi:hypothetical protein
MTYLISNPPNDDITYPLFNELIGNISVDIESYYMWSNPPLIMDRFFQNAKCSKPLAIIGVKDAIDSWQPFNWWHDRQNTGSISIEGFAKRHPDTTIILFTSLEQLELELNEPNLHIIPWGGDWVNQRAGYSVLEPVLDKNFDSTRTFICLNRQVRPHRLITLSYLFGAGYSDHGVISYLKNPQGNPDVLLDNVSWEFGPEHTDIREKILTGFDQLISGHNTVDDTYDIYTEYGSGQNHNIGNFENKLRSMYRNSFVEIVGESQFAAPSFFITEKTAHSFYGCNFPIIMSGCGTVAHLRELGLDVFDDIVDHTYDTIANPFDRIVSAIDSNRRLLTNPVYAKQAWIQCRSRFERNVDVMRTIYTWYESRTRKKLAKTLELIS